MKKNILLIFVFFLLANPLKTLSQQIQKEHLLENEYRLEDLDLTEMTIGWSYPKAKETLYGKPLTINGKEYEHGVWTHASSEMVILLKGKAKKFVAKVGVDDEAIGKTGFNMPYGTCIFEVWTDGNKVFSSGVMHAGDEAKSLSVDLTGVEKTKLIVGDAGDGTHYDHANWVDAKFIMDPGTDYKPVAIKEEGKPIKIKHIDQNMLSINGPRIVGTTPGKPFLYLIPATGKGKLLYHAANLPEGLILDGETGIISGIVKYQGETIITLSVQDEESKISKTLKIVADKNKLALTPPMGWTAWNAWGKYMEEPKAREAADLLVATGLAYHGYQYVNIDDAWEGGRDMNGKIVANAKYKDMKKMTEYIHSKGLKAGIYSSPGPLTCGRWEGSHGHVQQDADTYAEWGFDYLKYDWCSQDEIMGEKNRDNYMSPFVEMKEALENTERDFVYSLSSYGLGNVWEWGEEAGANLWRTTGDIWDTWPSMSAIGFEQYKWAEYAGPGHWNDPDMLVVGVVGWGNKHHPTRLTKNEQITHITLWSVVPSPLLVSCDLSELDTFTINLLTNDEVLAVNQDPLGSPGKRITKEGETEVWARPLWDGTIAVALFNRGDATTEIQVNWKDLNIKGKKPVRNIWLQEDLGIFEKNFKAKIPKHGAMLLKIGIPGETEW
jgi:alpha-galactosidase